MADQIDLDEGRLDHEALQDRAQAAKDIDSMGID